MRARLYLLTVVLTSLVVGGLAAVAAAVETVVGPGGGGAALRLPAAGPAPLASPGPSAASEPVPAPTPAEPRLDLTVEVTVEVDGFFSWAALDRRTGQRAGAPNQSRTSSTESVIKPWLAADLLRRRADAGDEPSEAELTNARRAIRDSHDGAAERLYRAGGGDNVIERMIDRCGLTDTEVYPGWWSRTEISARDAVRLGECLADGTAAGPEWTDWVLAEMAEVRGSTDAGDQPAGGRWGIIDGLPEQVVDAGVSIKNGWTAIGRTNSWHMACLAITEDWVMAVLMRYPAAESLDDGAQRCASVAEQLVREPVRPASLDGVAPAVG